MSLEQDRTDIAALIEELVGGVHTRTTVLRDPRPGHTHREVWTWSTTELPYLLQIHRAIRPGSSPGWDRDGALTPGRAGRPGSRPPVRQDALNLLLRVGREAEELRRRLRTEQGAASYGARQTITENLYELRRRAHHSEDATRAVLRAIRSWVYAARIVLGYDVPVTSLRDVCCPWCGGELRVRADASSDVYCPEPDCYDDAGERPRWSRWSWIGLLAVEEDEEMNPEQWAQVFTAGAAKAEEYFGCPDNQTLEMALRAMAEKCRDLAGAQEGAEQ